MNQLRKSGEGRESDEDEVPADFPFFDDINAVFGGQATVTLVQLVDSASTASGDTQPQLQEDEDEDKIPRSLSRPKTPASTVSRPDTPASVDTHPSTPATSLLEVPGTATDSLVPPTGLMPAPHPLPLILSIRREGERWPNCRNQDGRWQHLMCPTSFRPQKPS